MQRECSELRHGDLVGVPSRTALGPCVVRDIVPTASQLCGTLMYQVQSIESGKQVILPASECVMLRPSHR